MHSAAISLVQEVGRGSYDPERYGAQCSRCFLRPCRQGGPVPPEINPASNVMVVAEAPGEEEAKFGRPLIGKSGIETMQGLAAINVTRADVSWSNAVLCRPPKNDMDNLLLRLKTANKERAKLGLEPFLSPMEACRPRLVSELRLHQDVIALGKISYQSITGSTRSIMEARGMPMDGILDGKGRFHVVSYFPEPGELLTKLRVMPVLHPSFVLRLQKWRRTFRVDLSRAIRWFRGQMQWKEPQKIFWPSPQQIYEFLIKERHPFLVYDVETDAKEPLIARLRCIGFATPEVGMVVPLLSIDGQTRFWDTAMEREVEDILRHHFTSPTILKAGWNNGYYDAIVVDRQLGVMPAPYVDGILYHRGVESEMPHNLGYVGSVHTDVTDAWKAAHTAVNAQSDDDLHTYCLTDCVVTARVFPPLAHGVKMRSLEPVIGVHHEVQKICVGLHNNGMYVDQKRRREHDIALKKEAGEHRQMMRHILGDPDFNPNSRDQVADILFTKWGLLPEVIYENDPSAGKKIKKAYTKAGGPSTGDDNLRAMLMYEQREDRKAFLWSLRKFRGAAKLRGTNIIPLRPYDEPYYEVDDLAINVDTPEGLLTLDEDDAADMLAKAQDGKSSARQKRPKEKKAGLVMVDKRVHPHYNAHATTTQRLSSSEPNGQNWSRKIRDMITAQIEWGELAFISPTNPGRALIAADMDQLELRFAMALAGCGRYLEAFATPGADPHAVTCEMLYGTAFTHASEADKKRLRDFAKRFSYAVIYRATVETVHETLASSEDDNGKLVFPTLTLRETRMFHERFMKNAPEIEAWWDRDLNEFRQQGFLTEPVLGWRRDFANGEEDSMNEIANFKCQAGGSAIVHLGNLEFIRHVPFGKWGPGTGQTQQGHDAIMAEVLATHPPAKLAKKDDGSLALDKFGVPIVKAWCEKGCRCPTAEAAGALQESMTIDGRRFGLPVRFTAGAKAGFRWTNV